MTDRAEILDARRRRAVWRAGHRGVRELDLVLGRFAAAEVPRMDAGALADFERLLEAVDPDLQDWIFADAPPPAGYDGALLAAIRALRFRPSDFTSR